MQIKQIKEFIDNMYSLDISIKTRKRDYVDLRRIFCYVSYIYSTEYVTYEKIGNICNLDHSSVIHNIKSCRDLMEYDKEFTEKLREIEYAVVNNSEAFNESDLSDDYDYNILLGKYNNLLKRCRNQHIKICNLNQTLSMIKNKYYVGDNN